MIIDVVEEDYLGFKKAEAEFKPSKIILMRHARFQIFQLSRQDQYPLAPIILRLYLMIRDLINDEIGFVLAGHLTTKIHA